MTQPVRFAKLKGGKRVHQVKIRPGFGDWIARCGIQAWQETEWDYDPPESVKPCAYCNTKKPNEWQREEWDAW